MKKIIFYISLFFLVPSTSFAIFDFYPSGSTTTFDGSTDIPLNDDVALEFGTGAPMSCLWETADANANTFLCALPEGGATDVPGFVIGDASALNADLGLFNGITDPFLAVLSDDQTKAIRISQNGTNAVITTTSGDVLMSISGGNFAPSANDGAALGVDGTAWSDLFLAAGAVLKIGADAFITETGGILAFDASSHAFTGNVDVTGDVTSNNFYGLFNGDVVATDISSDTISVGQINGIQNDELLIQVPNMSAASDDQGLGIRIVADNGGTLSSGGNGGSIQIKAGNAGAGVGDASGGNITFTSGDYTNAGDRGYFEFEDADDRRVLLLTPVNGVATNYLAISNATTGNDVLVETVGTDSNIDLNFNLQGTGKIVTDAAINATGGGFLTGTWSDLGTVTTVDINGGTLDGTIIGSAAAAAATFTTVSQSGLTTYTSGSAITAGSYQCGRNNDATNANECNVPTGAQHQFSVNDVNVLTITGSNANMNNQPILNIGNGATDFGGNGQLTIGGSASASGNTILTLNQSSHTAITAVQPALTISSFTNTVNSGSSIAVGYAAAINPPTYQGVAGGGTETVTDMTTFYLPGPAIVGANLANTNTSTLWVDSGTARFDGRVLRAKSADVASGGTITMGNGNFAHITGTTTIDFLTTTGWTNGSIVTFTFDASVTVNHNTGAAPGGTSNFQLSGAANFSATANDTLTLILDGASWREVSRTVI